MKSRRYSIVDLAESLKPGADQRKAQFEQSISQIMMEPLGSVHDRVGAAIPSQKLAFQRKSKVGAVSESHEKNEGCPYP